MQVLPSAAFLPVTERSVWVQPAAAAPVSGGSGSGGHGGSGSALADAASEQPTNGSTASTDGRQRDPRPPGLLWLSASELQQVFGLQLDGSCFSAPAGAKNTFTYFRVHEHHKKM